jgi:hypothetical protein
MTVKISTTEGVTIEQHSANTTITGKENMFIRRIKWKVEGLPSSPEGPAGHIVQHVRRYYKLTRHPSRSVPFLVEFQYWEAWPVALKGGKPVVQHPGPSDRIKSHDDQWEVGVNTLHSAAGSSLCDRYEFTYSTKGEWKMLGDVYWVPANAWNGVGWKPGLEGGVLEAGWLLSRYNDPGDLGPVLLDRHHAGKWDWEPEQYYDEHPDKKNRASCRRYHMTNHDPLM